jgi:hypothetical protein
MFDISVSRNLGLSEAANIKNEWTLRNAAIDGAESQVWVSLGDQTRRAACPHFG